MLEILASGALTLGGTTFSIELPGERPVTAVVEHVERPALSDVVWRGPLVDAPGGWFLLVANQGAVVGEISVPGVGHYHVRDVGDGDRRIVRVDSSERLNCLGDASHRVPPAPAGDRSSGGVAAACGESVVVDVMIVYTTQAMAVNGGRAAIEALIDSYVEYTNMVYEASGVNHRLRLVHAQEVAYIDSGNVLTDLARLANPSDGHLDDVHPIRDAWGADLVSLISNTPSAGAGYGMMELSVDFASMAFSVLGADPAPINGGLVFAHETGHNMGCQHNNMANAPAALFCYSYGHRTPGPQWRTVLSNPPGTFVDFFSSPDLELDGFPLGVAGDGCPSDGADNVRTLNESAATVAMFRPTVVPLTRPDVNGDGVVNVDDLLLVILSWGPCSPDRPCPGDANGDGVVDVDDLLDVIVAWCQACRKA